MIGDISSALKSVSELSSIARELDNEGLTVDIRYQGKSMVVVGRQGHSLLLESIIGPVKIKGLREVIQLMQHVLKGVREDVSRD
ncbi:MAG: hypothetical protein LUP95_01910 [Euryarchaeota archaeon]|nr:hypothetical protein [Euryarchaeota archaeon]